MARSRSIRISVAGASPWLARIAGAWSLSALPRIAAALLIAGALSLVPGTASAQQLIISDPAGDNTNAAADITVVTADVSAGNISFTIEFATLSVPDVFAALNLDTDQNQATGKYPPDNGSPSQTVGVEYQLFLDIRNANAAPDPLCLILDGPTQTFLSSVSMTIVSNTVSLTIPLSSLGDDDGNMNVAMGAVNATDLLFADLAPDVGHGTVLGAGDVTSPTVLAVQPLDLATDVVRDPIVRLTFSESLDPTTVTAASLRLEDSGAPVTGTLALTGLNAIVSFIPDAALDPNTTYTVIATTGIEDISGNPLDGDGLGGDFASAFTTGTSFAPPLIATDPGGDAAGAHDVVGLRVGESVTTLTIQIDFNAFDSADASGSLNLDVDQDPFTGSNPPLMGSLGHDLGADFEVWLDFANINALAGPHAFLMDGNDRSFVGPEYPMTLGPTTASFALPLVDIGENDDGNLDWAFTVYTMSSGNPSDHLPDTGHLSLIAAIDRVAPFVVSVVPLAGSSGVPIETDVVLDFDGAVDASTIQPGNVFLVDTLAAATVNATLTLSSDSTTVTIDPVADLDDDVWHEVHVTTGVQDPAGNTLASEYINGFTTVDLTPPEVLNTVPQDGANDVGTSTALAINFTESVVELDRNNLILRQGSTKIACSYALTGDGSMGVVTPLLPMAGASAYTLTAEIDITDTSGNPLDGDGNGGEFVLTFTTTDTAPPDSLIVGSDTIPVSQAVVDIPVDLTNSFAVGGISFELAYDVTVLSYSGLDMEPRAAAMEYAAGFEPAPGMLNVTMLSEFGTGSGSPLASGSGPILILHFDVDTVQPATTSNLTVTSAELSEARGLATAIPATKDGIIGRDASTPVIPLVQRQLILGPAVPNPFNPRVQFQATLPVAGHVSATVYDARGSVIRILRDGEMPAGTHSLAWDGTDTQGQAVASGVYWVRLQTARGSATRKAVLVR